MSCLGIIDAMRSTKHTPATRLVWACLENHANGARFWSIPVREIAAELGLTRQTVNTAVLELARDGIIRIERRKRHQHTYYMLRTYNRVRVDAGKSVINEAETPELMPEIPAQTHGVDAGKSGLNQPDTLKNPAQTVELMPEIPAVVESTSKKESTSKQDSTRERAYARTMDIAFAQKPLEQDFSLWWEEYPLKKGKQPARLKYEIARRGLSAEDLLHAVRTYPFDLSRPDFLPHPATWLYQRRWEDDYAGVAAQNVARHRPRENPSAIAWLFGEASV